MYCFVAVMGSVLLTAGPAGAPVSAAPDLGALPVNQWVKVHDMNPGGRGWSGVVYCPDVGGMLYAGNPNTWNISTKLHTMGLFTAEHPQWADYKPATTEKTTPPTDTVGAARYASARSSGTWGGSHEMGVLAHLIGEDGRRVPAGDPNWGNEVCYDPDRKVIVAFISGETCEYDPVKRRWTVLETKGQPQAVYGSSLAYDPVNREIVLATGGFSNEGCPRTTWVYRGGEKVWTALGLGGAELNAVRVPTEALRDRLATFRWLLWKHVEFRTTGRQERLDERAQESALVKEASAVAAEAKRLAALAAQNAGLAKWDGAARQAYERAQLAAAGKELAGAGDLLAGLDAAVKGASPTDAEKAYRAKALPAVEALERAADALRVMPGPRMNAKLVADAKNGVIVCFGGEGQDRSWGDTWVYHCAGRWWEKKTPAAHPPLGRSMAAAYDPASALAVYVVGGQTWGYDAAKDEWAQFGVTGLGKDVSAPVWMDYDTTAKCFIGIDTGYHPGALQTVALRLDAAAAKRLESKGGPEVDLMPVDGPYVLRDAATVADLARWQEAMAAWAKGIPANTWVPAPTNGTGRPNWGRSWSSIVPDPHRRQLYYRDGGHGSYHGTVTDHYDLVTGRWFRSQRREEPPQPHHGYFAWGRSFSLGLWCTHTYKFSLYHNPVTRMLERSGRAYDPDTGRWLADPVAAWPAAPQGSAWIPVFGPSDRLVLVPLGRTDNGSGAVAVLTADGWKTSAGHGAFPAVQYPEWEFQVLQHDPKRNRVLRMGCGRPANTLWALDLDRPDAKWTDLKAKAEPEGTPLPESGREMIYLPKHDLFLMADGGAGKALGELCVYDPAKNAWRRFAPEMAKEVASLAKHAASDRSLGFAYDETLDVFFFISSNYPGPSANPPVMAAMRFHPASALWAGRR